MPDLAYVHNQRKDHLGQWVPLEAYETITVSTDYPYTATLSERPANGIDIPNTTVPEIPGLQITTNSGAIGPSEYYVNYLAGIITFHSSKAGLMYTVHYYKTGTVVTAEQINTVIARLVHFDRDPLPTDNTYEIGTMWVSTNTIVGVGTVRKIWLCSDVQNDEAKWSFQGPSLSVENDLDESTSVNVYGDGRIEFVILDEVAGCFNCSREFFVYNLGPIPGVVKNDSAGKLIGGQSVDFADMGITVDEPLAVIDGHLLHRLVPGNKHIPQGGSYGQVLRWTSNGTAAWSTISADYTSQIPINIEDDIISHEYSPGFMHVPAGGSSGQALIWESDGVAAWVTLPAGSVYAASAPIILVGNTFGHSASPGYKHIPSGGTTDNFLSWSSNGTAAWKSINLDGTFALNSDSEIPSQKAIKTYVNTTITETKDWETVVVDDFGTIIRPKVGSNILSVGNSICITDYTYHGENPYVGLRIRHLFNYDENNGTTFFISNGENCIVLRGTTTDFYGEANFLGNIAQINSVFYVWPNTLAPNFSVLSSDGFSPANLSWKTISTDGSMATNSDFVISSQRAIKTYVDTALVGLNYWKRAGYVISPANVNDWLNNPYKLQASFMMTAGLVRNDSSGYLSGGNTIGNTDISPSFVLPVSQGGTGLSSTTFYGFLFGVDSTTYETKIINGHSNRIILDMDLVPGNMFIKTPQDINIDSKVSFGMINLMGNSINDGTGDTYIQINPTTLLPPTQFRTILATTADVTGIGNGYVTGIHFHKFNPTGSNYPNQDSSAMGIELEGLGTLAGNTPGTYQKCAYGIKIGNIGTQYLQGEAIGIQIGNISADRTGYFNDHPIGYTKKKTVGLSIGVVSGGYDPLSIYTAGGNIRHEGCNLFSVMGYDNTSNILDRGSAYINLDYTCVNDMSSAAGIRWRMNGISKFELRNQYVTYTPGSYDSRIHDAGDLHFYACDDTGGFAPQSFPLMSLFRKDGVHVNNQLTANTFSTVGYYGNVHDVLEPPFPLGHIYYGYTEHPGSFIGGTIPHQTLNLWPISSVVTLVRSLQTGVNYYPKDHPRAFYPLYTLADHYGEGCCIVQHIATMGDCGQYITLPFTFQPGWRYELRARIKPTSGQFNCVKIGDSVGNWYDVWYDPNSTINSTFSTSIWHHFRLSPLCASGNMLNCNRLWLGDRDSTELTTYAITWVEVKQYPPTDTSAVGSTCYVSQEMVAADKIQFGGLRLDPSQIVPDSTSGNVGDIRIIKDNGSGECRLYTKVLPTVWKNVLLSL